MSFKNLSIIACLLLQTIGFSQIYDPVKWSTSTEKISNEEYLLTAIATIEPTWHLYAQNVPEDGPIATNFTFKENDAFELIGTFSEEEGHTVDDPVFEMKIKYFENVAKFTQKIKIKKDITQITGEVEFMACNDKQCLPPEYIDLSFRLGSNSTVAKNSKATFALTSKETKKETKKETIATATPEESSDSSLIVIFFIAFFSGFAALLTPCVFPMIPLTVSFFTKQSKSKSDGIRKAFLYGFFIIVIYVLLGVLITSIFGADALNALSTSVSFNLIFFLILVVFAVSFLGAFEIRLPSKWANKADAQSFKGGIVGIFFMALALAIVSFSCTGPIVGTLLVEAASKGGIAPIVGMLGFSSAIALPFTLFAIFPGWMNNLPKSGGWLNSVKVVLGLLELALALKFLSNADLVLQLHWLERETFLALWIAIFGVLALYLFGKIRFPHDDANTNVSVGRMMLGIIVLAFTLYLIPGLSGAPLKLISGFPPPSYYSEITQTQMTNSTHQGELPDGSHLGPHGLVAFTDYDKGIAYAQKVNKPILLDFTGHACVNCRKVEDKVWSDSSVLNILKNDIVLISLYVDDKRALPESEQITSKISNQKLKYIGQKWSEFQILRYKTNAQPYYIVLDNKGNDLSKPKAFDTNIDSYRGWLQEAIQKF